MTDLVNSIVNARNGFPDRMQRSLLTMMMDNDIYALHSGHLLWMLPPVCREDKEIDIKGILDNIISQQQIIPTALAVLALLHLTVEKNHSMYVGTNKAHEIPAEIKGYCEAVKHPTERCALMLMLCQRWMNDDVYNPYRAYETEYTQYFKEELKKAVEDYFKYIKQNDQKVMEHCKRLLDKMHYLMLMHQLMAIEDSRKQKPNVFAEMWR